MGGSIAVGAAAIKRVGELACLRSGHLWPKRAVICTSVFLQTKENLTVLVA